MNNATDILEKKKLPIVNKMVCYLRILKHIFKKQFILKYLYATDIILF
jgi:hypothetical protein